MPLYTLVFQVPQEYISFLNILYHTVIVLLLFHILHHILSKYSLFIHAFQGELFNPSFGLLLGTVFLTCFAWMIWNDQILKVHFEVETFEVRDSIMDEDTEEGFSSKQTFSLDD
jgi:hypothetical protein